MASVEELWKVIRATEDDPCPRSNLSLGSNLALRSQLFDPGGSSMLPIFEWE